MNYANISLPLNPKFSVDDKRMIESIQREAREKSKSDCCLICGKLCSSFKNSHTIPQFVLKNIYNGEKLHGSLFGDITDKGLRNTEVFRCICGDCESNLFKEYENPHAYLVDTVSQTMLAEISLKSSMQMIYKRRNERSLYQMAIMKGLGRFAVSKIIVGDLDLDDYVSYKDFALKYLDGNNDNGYVLHFYKKLNYVVPYAHQGMIAIVCDLNGKVLNDIYNNDSNYHLQLLNICIFPLDGYTVVFCFSRKKDTRYNRLFKQFNRLNNDDKLAYLNAVVFRYSESVILSDKIDNNILNDQSLTKLCEKSDMYIMNSKLRTERLCHDSEGFFIDYKNVTNLLDEKYKL